MHKVISATITIDLLPEEEFITLSQLLKLCNCVASGGEAHTVITDGLVCHNSKVDYRKRLKVRRGDKVQFQNLEIIVQ